MIDGTYKFEVDVPFGRKSGTLTLRTEGEAAFADIDAPMIGKKHMEGRAQGDTFTAQGRARSSSWALWNSTPRAACRATSCT